MLRTKNSFVLMACMASLSWACLLQDTTVRATDVAAATHADTGRSLGEQPVAASLPIADVQQSETTTDPVGAATTDSTTDRSSEAVASRPQSTPVSAPASLSGVQETTAADPPSVSIPSAPAPLPAVGLVLISQLHYRIDGGLRAFEIWNLESNYVDLSMYSFTLEYSQLESGSYADYECQFGLEGYIGSKQFASFVLDSTPVAGAYQLEGCEIASGQMYDAVIQVAERTSGAVVERLFLPSVASAERYERKVSGSYKTGVFATDFRSNTAAVMRVSALYWPPVDAPMRITEIFIIPELCATNDVRFECRPYVKIENTSAQDIDLSAYRLRSGKPTTSPSVYNTTPLSGVVAAGDYMIIAESATGADVALGTSEGTVWFEDREGFRRYDNAVAPYVGVQLAAQRSKAWAYDVDTSQWRWTAPSPTVRHATFLDETETNEGNTPTEATTTSSLVPCRSDQYRSIETNRCRLKTTETSTLVPCKEGQYRSSETNRCRTLASAVSTLTPCRSDQYRSPETNRCRSIAATASVAKPCAANQFRNPDTGRCKKIASATSTLKPCAPGQERNPETNRCRAKTGVLPATTAHSVEPVVAASTDGSVKWWALGGIMAVASLYGVWEWRREIVSGVRSMLRYGSSRP